MDENKYDKLDDDKILSNILGENFVSSANGPGVDIMSGKSPLIFEEAVDPVQIVRDEYVNAKKN